MWYLSNELVLNAHLDVFFNRFSPGIFYRARPVEAYLRSSSRIWELRLTGLMGHSQRQRLKEAAAGAGLTLETAVSRSVGIHGASRVVCENPSSLRKICVELNIELQPEGKPFPSPLAVLSRLAGGSPDEPRAPELETWTGRGWDQLGNSSRAGALPEENRGSSDLLLPTVGWGSHLEDAISRLGFLGLPH